MTRCSPKQRPPRRNRFHTTVLLLLCLWLAGLPIHPLASARMVRTGIYQNAPKIYLDDNGRPAGFFAELLESIAREEEWLIRYRPCQWEQCLELLERGEIDLMPDVAFNPARDLRFPIGHEMALASWSVVYARPGSDIDIVPDLDGKRIAVLRGGVQADRLLELTASYGATPQLIKVASFHRALELVSSGNVDGAAVNRFFGALHAPAYGLEARPILFAPSLLYFAASKASADALLPVIDRHLKRLKETPGSLYYRAYDRWFTPMGGRTLPEWALWALGMALLAILLLAVFVFLFRRVVRHQTSELVEKQDQLERLSFYDPLTGLPNRILFLDRLKQALQQRRRGHQAVAVLFIDLDGFKEINDSTGHQTGDLVLQIVSNRFSQAIREEDTVARLGGDEFTVLLKSLESAEQAAVVAEKLLTVLRPPIELEEQVFYLSASIGISFTDAPNGDAQELLRNADAAMYQAKETGRNTYRFYSHEMTRRSRRKMAILSGLRDALDNDELRVHYQPVFDLKTKRPIGAEALLRWNSPERGPIPPTEFIPVAEESGLIGMLGEWVLSTVCRQVVAWRQADIAPPRVAINLSGRQIQRDDLPRTIERILEETGCRPEWIELEVTEGFIMSTPETSIALLRDLRRQGISLAIDDFGTGYSSLAYLKRLPLSKLKIDRSFVRDIPDDPNDMAIVRAVVALGQSLGLTVQAEGIETEEQLRFLVREGCLLGQGFLLGRPMTAEDLEPLLSKAAATAAVPATTGNEPGERHRNQGS